MFDQRFFASKLGIASLVSITAMVVFNLYAVAHVGTPVEGLSQVGPAAAMVLA